MLRVCYRVGEDFVSIFSRATNSLVFGGSIEQTLSARAYVEARQGSVYWSRVEKCVNKLFFLQPDHCRLSWGYEVHRANRVLELNKVIDYVA